jgi:hypothetical protein
MKEMKSKRAQSMDETSSEGRPEDRIAEKIPAFKYPPEITVKVANPPDNHPCGIVLARDVTLTEFQRFLESNDEHPRKAFSLVQGSIVYLPIECSKQSHIHAECADHIRQKINVFCSGLHTTAKMKVREGTPVQSDTNTAFFPDVVFSINNEAKIVVEIAYSQDLANAHARIQQLARIPGVLGTILVKIRWPFDLNGARSLYDEDDGKMVYCYYSRPNNMTVANIPPDTVISFGNQPLTLAEKTHIANVTGFPVNTISGVMDGVDEQCDEEGLNAFCHTIPPYNMLVMNSTDVTSITGHPMTQLPVNHHFFLDLFLVKKSIHEGVVSENHDVAEYGLAIPTALPRL